MGCYWDVSEFFSCFDYYFFLNIFNMSKLLLLFGRAVFCYPLHDQNTMEWVVFKVPAWHTLPKFKECFTKKNGTRKEGMKPGDFHRTWRHSIIFRWTMLNLGRVFSYLRFKIATKIHRILSCSFPAPDSTWPSETSTISPPATRVPTRLLNFWSHPNFFCCAFWGLGHPNNPIHGPWLTVDGWKKSGVHQLRVGSLSMFIPLFARFMHSRWCKISEPSTVS